MLFSKQTAFFSKFSKSNCVIKQVRKKMKNIKIKLQSFTKTQNIFAIFNNSAKGQF